MGGGEALKIVSKNRYPLQTFTGQSPFGDSPVDLVAAER
jgi:hypothetical protein